MPAWSPVLVLVLVLVHADLVSGEVSGVLCRMKNFHTAYHIMLEDAGR